MIGKNKKFECDDIMDISTVSELHAKLKSEVEDGFTVTLRAENVERIDAATLQLFAAFCQDAGNRNIKIKWKNPSESLIKAARLLGLAEHLHLENA